MKTRIHIHILLVLALLFAPAMAHARFYQPETGRFITMDSYEGVQSDPASLHKYAYAHGDPVNNTDPSGHETLKTKLGKELHKKLGQEFIGKPANPLRFSGPSIATIVENTGIRIPGKVKVLFPDLVDANPTLKEVYEIKPFTPYGLATGYTQLAGYLFLFNKLDPSGGWHAGTSWVPPKIVRLSLGVAVVSPPAQGVIFYHLETIIDVARKGANAGWRIDEQRLNQHMGIATILSSMGAP